MRRLLLLLPLGLLPFGCSDYEDKRKDPTKEPGFVDTSDPSVVLGQQKQEREDRAKAKGGRKKL